MAETGVLPLTMSSLATPPAGLNQSGLRHWEKNGPKLLCATHFESFEQWTDYCDEQITARWKEKLFDGIDEPVPLPPRFLTNLCKILDSMQDEIDSKSDRESFW